MNERDTLNYNEDNILQIGGCDCLDLVKTYGTPLYVMDEEYIEKMCETFTKTMSENYPNGTVLYASKAFCCKEIYRIISKYDMGCDVVSAGEILTAKAAGYDLSRAYFHGNNKTEEEIGIALEAGVCKFVLDNIDEVDKLDRVITKEFGGESVDVLVRVNPGVEAHTHEYIQTANIDSKFGVDFETAMSLIKEIASRETLNFVGIHCHIGSQIFGTEAFKIATGKVVDFVNKLKTTFGIKVTELDLGGGFGTWYNDEDDKKTPEDYAKYLIDIAEELKAKLEKYKLDYPKLLIEPGRSIVGEAGITLYSVGTIKDIKGVKKYLFVDGGMFENPRYCLYQAKYTAVKVKKEDGEQETVTIAGKCCESGDLLIEDAKIEKCKLGDIIAILTTGAYNHSMASNYNKNPIPPVVMVKGGKSRIIVKGQTYKDLLDYDI